MKATFDFAMPKILVHEGGWSNHPKDPGGATMKGVIQRVYDAYRELKGLAKQSVRFISDSELFEIYKKQYWDAVKGDQLPQGVDYVMMDGAVNSGPVQSIKWLQRALGVKADGQIGQATLQALENVFDHDKLIADILERRKAFLKALKTFGTFGKGWMNRVGQVLKIGQSWAVGSVGPDPVFFDGMNRKAILADAKALKGKGAADATAGGGTVSLTFTAAIDQARDTLTPLAGDSVLITNILAALAVTSIFAVAGGLAYRFIIKHKNAQIADALDLGVQAS